MPTESDYSQILQVGLGFWPARTRLSAVELELFTVLGKGSMTGKEIGAVLGLHPRGISDFLDGLVAMGFRDREGNGSEVNI
jgi:hypothetical protein